MGGIGGKGWSAEGDAPEKCATLGIIRGRGPQAQRSGRGRVATFSGAFPSAGPQIQHSPSLGVQADGPQMTETGKNVVWGAARWTSNDEKGQKRCLGCPRMDLKRRKKAKTSSGVPANGPQTTKTGKNVVWGAARWTSNDGNGQKSLKGVAGNAKPTPRRQAKPMEQEPKVQGRKRLKKGKIAGC